MPKSYSGDLRERVVEAVVAGSSRRAAAERFEVSASSAIRWMQRWRVGGSVEAKPRGGSRSPLDEHAAMLLALNEARPDLTLDEICAVLREGEIETSRVSVWRFFERHGISFKKNRIRRRARAAGRGAGPRTLAAGSAVA